jgi:hypothetical protein
MSVEFITKVIACCCLFRVKAAIPIGKKTGAEEEKKEQ